MTRSKTLHCVFERDKGMREVDVNEIIKNIKEMCIEANHFLSKDMKEVYDAIRKIPIDNHQLPLKIRQLAVASSNFFSFPLFSLFYRNHPGSDVSHHLSCMQ